VKDVVISTVTGHQRGGGSRRKEYYKHHNSKLSDQRSERKETETKVLHGVRLYINGYLNDTTDIEMKRIVTMAGGQILWVSTKSWISHGAFTTFILPDTQQGAPRTSLHPNS
jgi:hypothetical protein